MPSRHSKTRLDRTELTRRALIHDLQGELEASIECWTACFDLTQGGVGEVHRLVDALLRAGLSGRAIEVARDCSQRMPDQAVAFYILGRALRISWHFIESVEAFEEACRLRPGWSLCETGLKQARRQLNGSPDAQQRREPLLTRFEEQHGREVIAGPFRGLRFPDSVVDVLLLNQLSGLYEFELQPQIETLISDKPHRVINIGGASGYYALGMAMRLPEAKIEVFERDEFSLSILREGAALNRLSDRLSIHGDCNPDNIRDILQPGDLVLCDCEGAELSLLRPDRIDALRHCSVLVELHDFIFRGTTQILQHRFGGTHTIQLVASSSNLSLPSHPGLEQFTPEELRIIAAELRPEGMSWAIMSPNS